ncbi:arsenite transport protein [Natrinema pellirubrum DSM 15624]|uniref:Arsenite transport protein n=1 Tax=Natrinema pellirubrum (strain DSM 15624 / CIP 106293 / JCM 10476 / NCIMB 786 / 157) TaxID=797303 RepID=L9Y8D1_NATP1|nr:arsenite transport protein [Natrinema pellirubrum DSM 15624]
MREAGASKGDGFVDCRRRVVGVVAVVTIDVLAPMTLDESVEWEISFRLADAIPRGIGLEEAGSGALAGRPADGVSIDSASST